MTREEAITYLNVIWNRYKAEYEIERETLDAYHMAIEALSADAETIEHIQCRECRHYNGWCDVHIQPRIETDYCNYAERR